MPINQHKNRSDPPILHNGRILRIAFRVLLSSQPPIIFDILDGAGRHINLSNVHDIERQTSGWL
jgi:hypothetical protein